MQRFSFTPFGRPLVLRVDNLPHNTTRKADSFSLQFLFHL
jgi:hypothetical protein